jgi:hypothetical protein
MSRVHKRLSLLKRNPAMSRGEFLSYYEKVHGPLASSQAGFRRFTYCYVQNHILGELGRTGEPAFDGMTVTFQVPRADMSRGFFQEPDYASVVRPDEERLFDLSQTISVLGTQTVVLAGEKTPWKCVALFPRASKPAHPADTPDGPLPQERGPAPRRVILNQLIPSTAGALGGSPRPVELHSVAEIWFENEASMNRAVRNGDLTHLVEDECRDGSGFRAFHVREVVMFCEARPDPV